MIKMDLEFRVGNRRVSSSQWARELTKEATRQAEKALEEEARKLARTVRCPTHGQTGKVIRRRQELSVEGCCDEYLKRFKARFR